MPTHRTVLVISDSDENDRTYELQQDRSVAYKILKGKHQTPISAPSYLQQIDAILLELHFPHSNSVNLLRQLKAQMGDRCPPIVVIDSGDTKTAVQAFRNGAADYLVREQLTPDDLRLSLRSAIENAELRRELQRSQQQFQTSVENMLDCFGIFSAMRDQSGQILDFRIDYLNAAACENNQMPKEMQIGRGLCEVLPSHRESGLFDEYCRVVETGEPLIKDSLIYDDTYSNRQLVRAFDIRATKLNDGFVASWRDVTDRKHLEANIQQLNRELTDRVSELQTLLDILPVGITIAFDPSCSNLQSNAYIRNLLGTRPGENLSKSAPAAEQPAYRTFRNRQEIPAENLPLQMAARGIEVRDVEFDILLPDGTVRQLLCYATPLRDDQAQLRGAIGAFLDITERKRVEADLRASEERFQQLTTHLPQVFWISEPLKQQVVYVSPAYETIWGRPIAALYANYQDWIDAIHLEDRDRVIAALNTSISQGSYDIEYRIIRPNGEIRWINDRAIAVRQEESETPRFAGIAEDITDRKVTEQIIAENETRLRGFVDANVVGMLYGDIYGNIDSANDELLRIVGFTREDLQAGRLRWLDITPPEYLPLDDRAIAEARANGACTPYEKEYIRKDGNRVPVLLGYSLVGEAREETVAFVLDLTDRKQAEAALQERTEHIQLLYETTRDLLSSTQPLALIETVFNKLKDLVGLDVYLNYILDEPQQKLHLAYYGGISQNIAQQIEWLNIGQAICGTVAQERRQIVRADIQNSDDPKLELARSLGATACACQPLVVQGRLFGTLSFGSLSRTEFTVAEQSLFQAICDQIAIALERSELLNFLQQQTEELVRVNRIKDEFLAILSHELRSPLNPILGWTKLLQSGKVSPPQTVQALATIERNANLQAQLIDDLLDLAKILRGKLTLNVSSVNLAFVIEAAIETVRTAATAKSISLHSLLPNVGQVRGDAARLQQVIWNLLSNAIKFTPSGGRVDILLNQIGHQAQIIVKDTGKGIRPEFLSHIFESFQQEDASITRKYGGLGLGLAIVRQLVEAHGGTITAESLGEGLGATFTVLLPLLNTEPEIQQSIQRPQPELDLTGIRVLAVDDEPDARDLLTVLLAQYGAEVLTVTSAAEVLANLQTWQPDILVSDIGMPEVDGYTLIQQVRTLPSDRGGYIPAIALTAYAREDDHNCAITSGYQQHITKPLEPEQLVQAIVTLIR